MSKRITVRLSDELVAFVDELVESGAARSRAAVVSRALTRERQHAVAGRDAEILSRIGPDPELEGLAEHAVELRSTWRAAGGSPAPPTDGRSRSDA